MITLILKAGMIPDGTKARKPTGAKLYTLRTEIKLFGEGAKIVKTDCNLLFLISEDGNIDIINPDKLLAVDMEIEDAIEFLKEL